MMMVYEEKPLTYSDMDELEVPHSKKGWLVASAAK